MATSVIQKLDKLRIKLLTMLNELQFLNLINLLTLYFMNTQKQVNLVTNTDLNTASQHKKKT